MLNPLTTRNRGYFVPFRKKWGSVYLKGRTDAYICAAFEEKLDLVAQQVEHITFNDRVLGSNPSEITSNHPIFSPRFFQVYSHK